MSDDLPDPDAGEEPARDTTRSENPRDRPVETDSLDARDTADTTVADGRGEIDDADESDETGDETDETEDESSEVPDETNGQHDEPEEIDDETTAAAEADVVDAAWRAAVDTGALVSRPARGSATGSNKQRRTVTHVPTDRLFELLASPGNRFVLTYLLRVDDRAEYAELVEYVVAQTDPPGGLTKGTFRGRVAARLVTESLPALADAGLVEVDSTNQVVAATPATRVAAPYLALALSDLVNPVGPE